MKQMSLGSGFEFSSKRTRKREDCWDNAAMENFFSTLKTERPSRCIHRFRDEFRTEVFDYIERFYNARRQHSTLGYVSPMQLEAAAY